MRKFVKNYPDCEIYNLDKLTYAGNLENLIDIQDFSNYTFIKGDIVDQVFIKQLFEKHQFTDVIHLAAESHVDRSISNPLEFINTNIVGTANLLFSAQEQLKKINGFSLFYHVSTDEVYGSLGDTGLFTEETAYSPRSPYSASKASSDHLVRSFYHTYGLPIVISNCSNNYGPNQFPEKLIPLAINNILNMKQIPVYGKGENVRDWLFVEDHASAIDKIFHNGISGETYNVGGENQPTNLEIVQEICRILDRDFPVSQFVPHDNLIEYVADRPGHDRRYAMNINKIKGDFQRKSRRGREERRAPAYSLIPNQGT